MKIQIGKLPRSIKEELFNVHATYTDNDATERLFYLKEVRVKTIDLNKIDDSILYTYMNNESIDEYANAIAENGMLEFGIVADGRLTDGLHRITTRKSRNMDTMYVLDLTGIINSEHHGGGSICEVEFTDRPVTLFKPAQKDMDLSI